MGRGRPTPGMTSRDVAAWERAPERRAYLVHGEETFLVERVVAALRRRFGGAGEVRVVWGDDDEARLHSALESRAQRGLFGGSATVIVRRVEAMRSGIEDAIEVALRDEGAAGKLILVGGTVDRRKRWYATARAQAAELVCAPLADAREVRDWVERLAEERALHLTADGARELIERCGMDLATLEGELEKLAAAMLPQPVDRAAVGRLVSNVREHGIEELTDRLARGDATGALRVLRGLLATGEPPLRIVGFLAANVRRSLHVAEEQERGASLEAIAARLAMPEWLVRRQLGRGSAAHLERALAALARLDLALKSSRPGEIVFEAALADLTASAG